MRESFYLSETSAAEPNTLEIKGTFKTKVLSSILNFQISITF